jgi:cell division protein ZapA
MGQVTLTLNGRTYSIGCEDGEEERLRSVGAHVRDKLEGLVREFGQAGEARLFLLSALLIADELFDARSERDTAASTAAAAVLREIADRTQPASPGPRKGAA